MKRFFHHSLVLGTLSVMLLSDAQAAEKREPASFYEKRFSISFRNTSLREALELIAAKGDVRVKFDGDVSGKVNYTMKDATLEDALEKISSQHKLDYKVRDGVILVSQSAEEEGSEDSDKSSPSEFKYRMIQVNYSSAKDLISPLTKALKKNETLVADDANNTLIMYSGEKTYKNLRSFISLYDKRPSQILIEAQIVETTKNFARDLGFNWGDTGTTTAPATSIGGGIITPVPNTPNLVLRGLLGSVDGRLLEAKLMAAESRGETKIVSRPKIFTLNNKKATIHSGLTYNIKVLTAVGSGGSAGGGSAETGGIKQISSGLQFDVTPTIVGDGLVKLAIKLANSEPNAGAAVDGVPGINDNSAETSILIKGGQTATMAGLLKKVDSSESGGAPWLSTIPVLGWLFKSRSDKDLMTELMIFLTPHIVDPVGLEQPVVRAPASEANVIPLPASATAPVAPAKK